MRLVCPNCEAKYEVPEDAIPETGRDVQCANCGHAWYQMRTRSAASEPAPVAPPAAPSAPPAPEPAAEVAIEQTPEPVSAQPPETPAEPAPPVEPSAVSAIAEAMTPDAVKAPGSDLRPEPPIEAAPVPVAASAPVADDALPVEEPTVEPAQQVVSAVPDDGHLSSPVAAHVDDEPAAGEESASDAGDEDPEEAPAVPGGTAAYAVDDSVLAILREEAEREAQARRAEAVRPLETQQDLGLEQAMPAVRKPVEDVVEDNQLSARRAVLPDVEEINSTLRPSEIREEDAAPEPPPPVAEPRSSFRSGFLLVVTVAILGSAIYGSADTIARMVPALEGPLDAYVGFVDGLRLHLDGLMQSATVAINGG